MNDLWYRIVLAAVFAVQLLLCRFAARRIVKWIPALLILLLMLLCIALYAASGGSNWAFLILLFLISCTLPADGAGWLAGMLWLRCAKKSAEKNCRCKEKVLDKQ